MEPEMMETAMTDTAPAEESGAAPSPLPDAAPAVPDPVPSEDVTDRLAREFLDLTAEFPELADPARIPDAVLDTAAGEGIPLLDAYLRYRRQEEKRVAAAAHSRQQAAARSAGSLSRGAMETPPEQDAFLRAFRSAL